MIDASSIAVAIGVLALALAVMFTVWLFADRSKGK